MPYGGAGDGGSPASYSASVGNDTIPATDAVNPGTVPIGCIRVDQAYRGYGSQTKNCGIDHRPHPSA